MMKVIAFLVLFALYYTCNAIDMQFGGYYSVQQLFNTAATGKEWFKQRCNRAAFLQATVPVRYHDASSGKVIESVEVAMIDTESYPQIFYLVSDGSNVIRRFRKNEYHSFDGRVSGKSSHFQLFQDGREDMPLIATSANGTDSDTFEAINNPDTQSFTLQSTLTNDCLEITEGEGVALNPCNYHKQSQQFKWTGAIATQSGDEVKWLCRNSKGDLYLDALKKCHFHMKHASSERPIENLSVLNLIVDSDLQYALRTAIYPFEWSEFDSYSRSGLIEALTSFLLASISIWM